MHKYLRSIGFSEVHNTRELKSILKQVVKYPDGRQYVSGPYGDIAVEFRKNFLDSAGIVVCGEYEDDTEFNYEYYFPYFKSPNVSSSEEISVERHAEKESYAGICDDLKVGVSLIFYLINRMDYMRFRMKDPDYGYDDYRLPDKTTVNLSGLALSGSIMLPIRKDPEQVQTVKARERDRKELLVAARAGDEDAIESLTLEDIDTYSVISRRIRNEDVFTLVDSYFMPYGIECDQYSVLGEIVKYRTVMNELTNELVYIITLNCNDLIFDICINRKDLLGEPKLNRRFKGTVWMQGFLSLPER
ncbi:MAG: DUF3881 family protein [Lachnospiraceae bacterium]|nr:DUF3881 family protein [Lachnospiraceae bacterium]